MMYEIAPGKYTTIKPAPPKQEGPAVEQPKKKTTRKKKTETKED